MKTEAELKSLAEFAAEFLKWHYKDTFPTFEHGCYWFDGMVDSLEIMFFEKLETAPIFAHLGKREMERREFQYKHYWDGLNHEHLFMKPETNSIDEWDFSNKISEGYHPNTFIALWSAIESAVNNEKDKTQ